MKAIWKYQLPKPNDEGILTIDMPWDAAVLQQVGMQDDQLVIWVLVDTTQEDLEEREFCLVNTGRSISTQLKVRGCVYVGTCTTSNGVVWHLFDLDKRL